MRQICTKCYIEKELADFQLRSDSKTGFRTICESCEIARRASYYQANKDKIKIRNRIYSATLKYLPKQTVSSKHCGVCDIEKPSSDFYKHNRSRDGLAHQCKSCHKAYDHGRLAIRREMKRKYRENNRDKIVANQRIWYAKHRERVNKQIVAKYESDPQYRNKRLSQQRKYCYGISDSQYDKLLVLQNNRCAVCDGDDPGKNKNWSVDHNHDTQAVRGLLCNNCNRAIGLLQESRTILLAAAEYLLNPPARFLVDTPPLSNDKNSTAFFQNHGVLQIVQ